MKQHYNDRKKEIIKENKKGQKKGSMVAGYPMEDAVLFLQDLNSEPLHARPPHDRH